MKLKYFQRERLRFIMDMLNVYGYINCAHIQRKFEMSRIKAISDLRAFRRLHPGVMRYDRSRKAFFATGKKAA